MTELFFKVTASRSILLDAMVEKNKHSYMYFALFSQPEFPSTAPAKNHAFPPFFQRSKSQTRTKNGSSS